MSHILQKGQEGGNKKKDTWVCQVARISSKGLAKGPSTARRKPSLKRADETESDQEDENKLQRTS